MNNFRNLWPMISICWMLAGCSYAPKAVATPGDMARLQPGMSRAQVRAACGGDDGSLSLRSQQGANQLEVRELEVKTLYHSYYLFFRNGRLAALHPRRWNSTDDAITGWSRRAGRFPAEQPGRDALVEVFSQPGIPFHGDFSAVDTQAKAEMQQENNEMTAMVIGLSWWNPIAWVALPIIGITFAAEQDAMDRAAGRIDSIPLGASMQEVTAAVGEPRSSTLRPDGWTYLVFNQAHFLATVAMHDGKVGGVYPYKLPHVEGADPGSVP